VDGPLLGEQSADGDDLVGTFDEIQEVTHRRPRTEVARLEVTSVEARPTGEQFAVVREELPHHPSRVERLGLDGGGLDAVTQQEHLDGVPGVERRVRQAEGFQIRSGSFVSTISPRCIPVLRGGA